MAPLVRDLSELSLKVFRIQNIPITFVLNQGWNNQCILNIMRYMYTIIHIFTYLFMYLFMYVKMYNTYKLAFNYCFK